ncbi:MAG: hypothetical protein LKF93_09655 [Bifidobacterium tibiigranuli]|nr:hypothetical protein [Bifidobacterium tibiigranuli]
MPQEYDPTPAPDEPEPATLADAVHQLTRIADSLTPDGTMEVTREQAAAAWEQAGMRIYQDRWLDALGHLGITIV